MKNNNYFKLPNSLFSADLTANEFSVLTYLISLHTNIKGKNGCEYKRVRQKTIAHNCGLKTAQSVSRITKSLMAKGYITHILGAYRADRLTGTYTYVLNSAMLTGNYTKISRTVFSYGLTAKQLKVYLYIIKSIDSKLGYCWNSYNDIAAALNLKRSEVMLIVKELVIMKRIRKMRKLRYDNLNVYSDNAYSLKVVKYIEKRCCIKELQPRRKQDCNKELLISVYNNAANIACIKHSTVSDKCQALFKIYSEFLAKHKPNARLRRFFYNLWGKYQNRSSIYNPVNL